MTDYRDQTDTGNKAATLWLIDGDDMSKVAIFGVVLVGLAAAGLVVLSSWQIPAPTTTVNKVIPDDKLPK
ncbi:MAG: hypothetical protein VW499_00590 [Candidatus Puniceispirillum sp.]